MNNFELIMPSEGDMELLSQENGKLTLKPIYYGGECAGPIIKFGYMSYRLKLKSDGRLELKKADTTYGEAASDEA